jgi:hypothetical protein
MTAVSVVLRITLLRVQQFIGLTTEGDRVSAAQDPGCIPEREQLPATLVEAIAAQQLI